ncbi:MAG: YihA family ribosome biogenesis GTP-binding protein [Proteobacteria bacterium]|nr:MAG: YihA family ribosome biogenesis GTP-binding protein [Pseudomonadota bacterium]
MDQTNTDKPINLNSARFLVSAHYKRDWPEPTRSELAFAGRSNVGKSSAINAITRRRGLAKTSKTPGRTQQIVFFELDCGHRLVDLPGYGFAKVPLDIRRHWERIISDYLANRETLRALILPMDARRPLTPLDRQMLDWSAAANLAVHILLTKSDKLSRNQAARALLSVRRELADVPRTTVQLFSAQTRTGVDEASKAIIGFLEAE